MLPFYSPGVDPRELSRLVRERKERRSGSKDSTVLKVGAVGLGGFVLFKIIRSMGNK